MSTLYIIATPIGNLEDITLRALRVLKEVDVIFAEDTRHAKQLLSHFNIHTSLERYDEHSHETQSKRAIEYLGEGKNVALVSDAGTPCISDPGARLVTLARKEGIAVTVIPGPSAVTAALSIAGISGSEFVFLGFPPHKKGRETFFKKIAAEERTVVFYESSHRIIKALEALQKYSNHRTVVIARELTKIYEEVLTGTAEELVVLLEKTPEKQKGEVVVIVHPKK